MSDPYLEVICGTWTWKGLLEGRYRGVPIEYLPCWLREISLTFQTSEEGYRRLRESNSPP